MVISMSYIDDDHGGSTAQFQAFAEREDDPRPRGSGSRIWLISGLVVAAAVIVVIVASLA